MTDINAEVNVEEVQGADVSVADIPDEAAAAIESEADRIAQEAREKGYDPEQYAQWCQEASELGMDVDDYIAQRSEQAANDQEAEAVAAPTEDGSGDDDDDDEDDDDDDEDDDDDDDDGTNF